VKNIGFIEKLIGKPVPVLELLVPEGSGGGDERPEQRPGPPRGGNPRERERHHNRNQKRDHGRPRSPDVETEAKVSAFGEDEVPSFLQRK
jgi:hypothetical protein